jgi:hypothetical protein
VRHVIDKVILYLTVPLLSEDGYNREDKGNQQYESKDD